MYVILLCMNRSTVNSNILLVLSGSMQMKIVVWALRRNVFREQKKKKNYKIKDASMAFEY